MNKIEGFLRTVTPMNVASPEDVAKGSPSPIVKTKVVFGDRIEKVPYFPGNDLRGRMRRKIAEFVFPVLREKYGKGLPKPLYLGVLSGTAYARPNSDSNSIRQIMEAQDNVFLGLMGGGPNLFQSGMQVNRLMPVLPSTVASGTIRESIFGESPFEGFVTPASTMVYEKDGVQYTRRGRDIIDTFHFTHLDDMKNRINADLARHNLENYEMEISAHIANAMGNKKDRAEDSSVKKTDLSNILDCEIMACGVDLYTKITFDDRINEAQIGLALLGLEGVLVENRLGGWGRIGFGQVKPLLVLEAGDTRINLFAADEKGTYRLTEAAKPYTDAALEAVRNIDVDRFIALFESTIEDAPKEAKKKKGKSESDESSAQAPA